MAADVQHAHHLLDQLGPGPLAAVVHLLETIVSLEEDRDSLSPAERKAVAEADEWLKHNQPIPDHVLPLRGGKFVARKNLAHFIIQNFGGSARQRVQPVIAQHQKIVAQGHAGQFDAVDDFHRRKSVNVHSRHCALYRAQYVAVIKRWQTVRSEEEHTSELQS